MWIQLINPIIASKSNGKNLDLYCVDNVEGIYYVAEKDKHSKITSYAIISLDYNGNIVVHDADNTIESVIGTYSCTGESSVSGTGLNWLSGTLIN